MNTLTHSPKRLLAIAGLALALPLTAFAFQGQGGKGGCEMRDGMLGAAMPGGHGFKGEGMGALRGLHRLDLSEAQDDKIFDIMHTQAPLQRKQMQALRKSEQELRTLKTAPDYNEAKAKQLIDGIARQRADLEMARLQAERKVLDVLTPEQRKQLSEMKPAREGKPGPRDERGPRSGA